MNNNINENINNNENEMNIVNNDNENDENNENQNDNDNVIELEISRPRRQHRVPSRFQLTQSPIVVRNRPHNEQLQRDNRLNINANNRIVNDSVIENARVDVAVTLR
jgi:hypothetical protein